MNMAAEMEAEKDFDADSAQGVPGMSDDESVEVLR